MAAPSYTTDLADINTADAITNWTELNGHSSGGAATAETDYFIQGTGCISQAFSASKSGTVFGLEYDYGSDLSGSFSAGDCVFVWQVVLAGNAIDSFDNGGLRFGVGSSSGNIDFWKTGGRDFGRNPYGGWQNYAIDPTYTADYSEGTPTGAYQIFGSWPNTTAIISKGNMHGVDAIRYGRGELIIEFGEVTNGYGNFGELSNANDANAITYTGDTVNTSPTIINVSDTTELYPGAPITGSGIPASTTILTVDSATQITISNNATATASTVALTTAPYNRWGLLKAESSGYLWKGLMSFGNATNACQFVDANVSITVDDTPRTYAGFNAIEVNNASTVIDWTNISFVAVNASQLSPGSFEMIDDASVTMTGCSFTDMTTFIFDSNATINETTFRRCGQVTQAGGTFDACIFEDSEAAESLLADNPSLISNCIFDSDGSNHAIRCDAVGTYSFVGHTFVDYATSDGSTGNEVFYNNSGGLITLNATDVTGTISVRNGVGASTVVNNNITYTITILDENATAIVGAQVAMFKSSDDSVIHASSATNGSGQVTGSVTASTGAVYIRVRQSNTADSTRYYPTSTVGSIGSTAFSVTITMIEDTTVA